jgi:hypothetical protein
MPWQGAPALSVAWPRLAGLPFEPVFRFAQAVTWPIRFDDVDAVGEAV